MAHLTVHPAAMVLVSLLTVLIILLPERPAVLIRARLTHTVRPVTMVRLPIITPPTHQLGLCLAQDRNQLLPDSARLAITGCLTQEAGVWQTEEPMSRAVLPGVGQPFLLPKDGIVNLVLPGTSLAVLVNPQGVARVQQGAMSPVHTNTVVLQAITGTAQSVWQVAMKVQVGQILLPDPKAGVSLLQAVAVPTRIGIMEAVTAEAQALLLEVAVPRQAINARV